MPVFQLFPPDRVVGVFRGFSQGGLEFHANLVLPYRNEFQNIPMHGQFLLVQLETEHEGVLGRITSLASAGKLAAGIGEEYNLRAWRAGRPVPEDLREQYLKYDIDIRVRGVLRLDNAGNKLTFVASHRRLPHVGSPVAFLADEVLREIASHNVQGADIGHFALGEYIYAGNSPHLDRLDWMQIKEPEVLVRFPIENLVSPRRRQTPRRPPCRPHRSHHDGIGHRGPGDHPCHVPALRQPDPPPKPTPPLVDPLTALVTAQAHRYGMCQVLDSVGEIGDGFGSIILAAKGLRVSRKGRVSNAASTRIE